MTPLIRLTLGLTQSESHNQINFINKIEKEVKKKYFKFDFSYFISAHDLLAIIIEYSIP